MHVRPLVGLVIAAACGALACGGGGGGGGGGGSNLPTTPQTPSTPSTPSTSNDVLVENNNFNPATITVPVGSTVKWTWSTCSGGSDPYAGSTCVDHSVTWDVTATDSPTQSQGTYQRAFSTAGTYTYHCVMHGAAMSGKVVVQ